MKNRVLSVILASLLVAGMVGTAVLAAEDNPGIVLPEDSFTSSVNGTETADPEEPQDTERAKGVVFTEGSGIFANPYTGYVSGIFIFGDGGEKVGDVLSKLENRNGIEIRRDGAALDESESVMHGDKVVLTAEDGSVLSEFTVIMMGDANMDSRINLSDASTMMKIVAKWDVKANEAAADVDGSGNVTLSDVSTILKIAAQWTVQFVKDPVLPGRYTMVNKNDVPCYGTPPEGVDFVPLCLSDGIHTELGVKFNVAEGEFATKIAYFCPSWGDDKGTFTVSIYKWNGDYNSSVAAMPIVSKTFVDYEDNATLMFDLTDSSGKGLVPGEYVWRMHDGADAGEGTGVGIWFYSDLAPAEDTGMKTFLNCEEFNLGPVANIYFATAK